MSIGLFYGVEEQERLDADPHDTFVNELSNMDEAEIASCEMIIVYEWRRIQLSEEVAKMYAKSILEDLLNSLDEEYADPDGDYTEETENMKASSEKFVKDVLKEYKPWICERTGNEVKFSKKDIQEEIRA